MEFRDNEAIYLQIAAFVCDNILVEKWTPGQKILSVRDLAIELEVNPNTVMRSYEFLQDIGVVYNRRGLGLFVSDDAFQKVKAYRKELFVTQHLPELFKNMQLLDISTDDIRKQYERYLAGKSLLKMNRKNEDKQ
jgi:DNA-binding transcriptional regulator YhcF (GntR family)